MKYIFITTEGFTYQPNSESPEPDVENMQVIGFGEGDTAKEALRKMLGRDQYLTGTNFDEVFAIRLASDDREYLSLREAATSTG